MIKRHESFDGAGRREDYDATLLALGYAMVATRGDCGYYGIWTNPATRTIVRFVEGDVAKTTCGTDAEFAEELRRHAAWRLERRMNRDRHDARGPARRVRGARPERADGPHSCVTRASSRRWVASRVTAAGALCLRHDHGHDEGAGSDRVHAGRTRR